MRPAVVLATALVRCWTRIYTVGMPPSERDGRRAEIDSDLWEDRDANGGSTWLPLQIVARLALGVPADLLWRVETDRRRAWRVSAVVGVSLAASLAAVVVVWPPWTASPLPTPEPIVPRNRPHPVPPPPPPPFCNPPGSGRPEIVPCTPWP